MKEISYESFSTPRMNCADTPDFSGTQSRAKTEFEGVTSHCPLLAVKGIVRCNYSKNLRQSQGYIAYMCSYT